MKTLFKGKTISFIFALLLINSFLFSPVFASDSECKWNVSEIQGKEVAEVSGPQMRKRAKEGRLIELNGVISAEACASRLVQIDKITIEGESTDGNTVTSWSFPIVGIGMYGSYDFPEILVKGALSFKAKTGEGYRLSREKEGDVAKMELLGKAAKLGFAFIIPENSRNELLLNMNGEKFPFNLSK